MSKRKRRAQRKLLAVANTMTSPELRALAAAGVRINYEVAPR